VKRIQFGRDKRSSFRRLLDMRAKRKPSKTEAREQSRVFVLVRTPKVEGTYEITADGAVEIDKASLPQSDAVLLIFEGGAENEAEASDRRIALPRKMGARAIREHVDEIVGEKARMIRSPEHPQVVYARKLRSLDPYGSNTVIPGAAVVDHIVPPGADKIKVVPVILNGTDGSVLAVVNLTVRPGGDSGITTVERLKYTKKPAVTIDELVVDYIASVARALKVEAIPSEDVLGPTQRELFELARTLPAYANEDEFFGMPASRALKLAVVGSAVLASVSIAGNVVMGAEAGYLALSAQKAQEERDEFRKKIDQTLTSDIRSYAAAASIDLPAVLVAANEVWHTNSLVGIECTTTSCIVNLSAGVQKLEAGSGADTASQLLGPATDKELMKAVLSQPAPRGYHKKEVVITGDGNVVTVTFEQQKPDDPVYRLLPH
jgi:hypothetical protein